MDDPYETLGVKRDASADEIRSAYRKLAKLHHPDLNPGKKEAEERFKTVSAAYDLLSDKDKRARFDRGEIDASGAEKPPERNFYRDFGDAPGGGKYRAGSASFDPDDLSSIFGEAFGRRSGGFGGGQGFAARGADAHYTLSVAFLDAAAGAKRRLTLPDGNALDVNIPAGVQSGQILRLSGKGMPGFGDGPPGDALIEINVEPHAFFRREGRDIHLELPVTLQEAILGAKVDVPTISGTVSLKIPPNSTGGAKLRLKGKGINGGDQYVELKIALPADSEPELEEFLKGWTPHRAFNPRKHMGGK
ncbi:MAG TPA: DnaJ C-terminal domain-containing protein [Parvibaculum sp.]|jgi:DnaJ-class molecular chaperone